MCIILCRHVCENICACMHMFNYIHTTDGQSCVDTVNVRQKGIESASSIRQVIVPRSNFSCNGRITGYLISLEIDTSSGGYPSVQVWHPMSSSIYNRVGTLCTLTANDINRMTDSGDEYYLGNVSCTGSNRIEFQSGDVIGYHQGSPVLYKIWNIETRGYTSYYRDSNSPLTTFSINSVDGMLENRQPLIQVMFGKMSR